MISKLVRSRALVALALPILAAGFAFAGNGADCHKKDGTVAAGKGSHCHLTSKNIAKTYELTDDGAVVTLTGKTEKAIGHIKDHFALHEKGEKCEGCPLGLDGVTADFEVTDEGGIITVTASTPETVESVQKWAKAPAGQCCSGMSDKA